MSARKSRTQIENEIRAEVEREYLLKIQNVSQELYELKARLSTAEERAKNTYPKIQFIKRLREMTGCGLKEAKLAVEAICDETFTNPNSMAWKPEPYYPSIEERLTRLRAAIAPLSTTTYSQRNYEQLKKEFLLDSVGGLCGDKFRALVELIDASRTK